MSDTPNSAGNDFARRADLPQQGAWRSLFGFLMQNKKWWLLPIILCLLALWALILVGGSGAAPFIYALF